MDYFVIGSCCSLHYGFTHRRVRVNGLMISCAVTPFFRAKTSSAIISVTLAPTRCAPSSVWSLALKISFINPSLAPAALAFPEAVKGSYRFSVRNRLRRLSLHSGRQRLLRAKYRYNPECCHNRSVRGVRPANFSTQQMASAEATWAEPDRVRYLRWHTRLRHWYGSTVYFNFTSFIYRYPVLPTRCFQHWERYRQPIIPFQLRRSPI